MTPDQPAPWSPPARVGAKIDEALFKLQMSAPGRAYVEACVKKGPSRKVQGGSGNVLVRFTSAAIGIQVMLESRHGEFPLAVLLDADINTICFFAQAPSLRLEIKDSVGKVQTSLSYTPDLLVIRPNEIVALELRDLTRLCEQNFKNPYQFYRDEEGCWHYRAAEEALAALGIKHQVIDNSSIPSVVVRNVRFLEDYSSTDCPPIDSGICAALKKYIAERRFVPMLELIGDGKFAADDVFKAVVDRQVYVDLTKDLLDSTSDLIIFSDAATHAAYRAVSADREHAPIPVPGTMHLRTGSQFTYNGKIYRVLLVGERDVSIRDEHGVMSTLPLESLLHLHKTGELNGDGFISPLDKTRLADCSPEELDRAMKRLDAIDNPSASDYSSRSITGFRRRIEGAENRLDQLIALIDRQELRGNTVARVSDRTVELGTKAIEDFYNTPEVRSKKSAYHKYVMLCAESLEPSGQIVAPVSYQTFCRWCTDQQSIKKRKGKRAAYQASRIVASLDNTFPVHGTRPHEVLYVDHTTIVLATISPNGVELGKPTLTLGSDGHTTEARAFILSYWPASTKLILLLLRDYVRRWRRLPKLLALDNGPEFHSNELAYFCKIYGIDIRYRTSGQPRGGAPIERLIGATEDELFGQLEGNTVQMRDPRLVTKSVNPFNRAKWTLAATYNALEKYLFDVRLNRVHPTLGMTQRRYSEMREMETGSREHVVVAFDENLMLMTSPHARRRMHVVDQRRGVYTDGFWYQHPLLKSVPKGVKVEVRVEPWLHRVIYVYVNRRWVTATTSNSRWMGNRSRYEVEVALREEKRLAASLGNKATLTPEMGREITALWNPKRFDSRIAVQQEEMNYIYKMLGMTEAMPSSDLAPPKAVVSTTLSSEVQPKMPVSPVFIAPEASEVSDQDGSSDILDHAGYH